MIPTNNDKLNGRVPMSRPTPKYNNGARRSIERLKALQFDPITELVKKYRLLEEEISYQERLRSGAVVELTSSGKPRAYRAEILLALYDRLQKTSEALLRYGYSRVPETNTLEVAPPAPLVINLSDDEQEIVVPYNEED